MFFLYVLYMSNYKYNKYKNKYINYKNQSGGVGPEDVDNESIIKQYFTKIPIWYVKKISNHPLLPEHNIEQLRTTDNKEEIKKIILILNDFKSNNIINLDAVIMKEEVLRTLMMNIQSNCRDNAKFIDIIKIVDDIKNSYSDYVYRLRMPDINSSIDAYNHFLTEILSSNGYTGWGGAIVGAKSNLEVEINKYNNNYKDYLLIDFIKSIKLLVKKFNVLIENSSDTQYKQKINSMKTEVINLVSNKKLFIKNIERVIEYLTSPYNNSSTTVTSADTSSELGEHNSNLVGLRSFLTFIDKSDINKKVKDAVKLLISEYNTQYITEFETSVESVKLVKEQNKIPENLYNVFKSSEYLNTIRRIKNIVTTSYIDYNIEDDENTIEQQIERMLIWQTNYEIYETIANNIANGINA